MKYSTHIDKAAEPTIDSFSLLKAYHISDRMTDNNLWHVNTKKKMKNHTHNLFLHPLGDLYWEPRVKGPLAWIDNERAVDRLRYPSDECSDYRAPENWLRIHGCFCERCRIGIGKISAKCNIRRGTTKHSTNSKDSHTYASSLDIFPISINTDRMKSKGRANQWPRLYLYLVLHAIIPHSVMEKIRVVGEALKLTIER